MGCCVIEELALRKLPPDVEVMDGGTPGVGLLHLLEGRTRALIVDAAEMGRLPGEVARFRPEEVKLLGSTQRFSLHRSAVSDALALARELGLALPEIIIYAVQVGRVAWSEELSPPVEAAMPRLIDAILDDLG